MQNDIIKELKTVYDPEITSINIANAVKEARGQKP